MPCPAWTLPHAPQQEDTHLKEGSRLLCAGGRVPPGLQGVPRSGARGGRGELGCQGRAAGHRQLLVLLYRLEPLQQLPWGDLAWPHWLMARAGARGCRSGEGPGPWSLGREGTAETGGLGRGRVGGGRAGRCWRPGLTPVLRPGDALQRERVLSPRGCECAAAGRPCLGRPRAGCPEGVCAGPVLWQLRQRLEVHAPDHELLNGRAELLVDGGRGSPGLLIG